MIDVLTTLRDLKEQATKERSHYYVAATADHAIKQIQLLRKHIHRQERDLRDARELIAAFADVTEEEETRMACEEWLETTEPKE